LQALQAAHRKGIIHRDLKPDNIFLAYQQGEPPVVKIIDFGISKFTQGELDKWRTKTGSVMGTPAYMSPEQARGSAGLDHRTDIYSMGTILFEMLTGVLPFAGNNFAEYLSAMLTEDPRAPQSLHAGFPVEAERVVRKALAKNPDQRFASATEMLDALAALPSYDARQERLTLLASTVEVRGFAAGDLGQALSVPGSSAADKAGSTRMLGASMLPAGARRWRWVVAVAALAVVAAGLAWWLNKPSKAPATIAPIVSQPAPSPPAPAAELPAVQPSPPSEPALLPRAESVPAEDEPVAGEKKSKKKSRSGTVVRPAPSVLPGGAADTQTTVDPTAGKRLDKKLRKGTRGTEMSEDFE
jgi:serine/threonine-protein kinase